MASAGNPPNSRCQNLLTREQQETFSRLLDRSTAASNRGSITNINSTPVALDSEWPEPESTAATRTAAARLHDVDACGTTGTNTDGPITNAHGTTRNLQSLGSVDWQSECASREDSRRYYGGGKSKLFHTDLRLLSSWSAAVTI